MRGSSAHERPRLAGLGMLLPLAGVVGAMLCVLLPEAETLLASRGGGREVDEIALAYLRAALRARPEDVQLRLRLARGQARLGQTVEARAVLEPLLTRGGEEARVARLVLFEVELDAWRRTPAPGGASALGTALAGLLRDSPSPEAAAWLRQVALELGRPELSAAAAEVLAGMEPGRRAAWLSEAGRQWLAAGEAGRAAEAWARGAEVAREEHEGVALARRALQAARGLAEAGEAVVLAGGVLRRFPGHAELLEDAVALAQSHGALAEASRWSAERAALSPEDVDVWRHRREVALAAGDSSGALEACRRLVRLRPDERGEWEWLARVAGWAGAPETELEAWHRLSLREGRAGPVARAVALAVGLRDMRRLTEVLAARARHAVLSDEELSLLVEAYERLGEPERAEAVLLAARGRGPEWLGRLARLQERQGRLSAALGTWEALEASGEAPAEPLRAQGELLWRMGRTREALARLGAGRERVGPEALAYWRLLGALAWSLDADAEALAAYRVVRARAPEDVLAARRLARLSADAGRVAELEGRLEVSRAAYLEALAADAREVPARLGLLRVLARLEERPGLATYLMRWEAEARESPSYFEPYARALQGLGRPAEAAEWFGRWARSRPEEGWAHAAHARALEEVGDSVAARRAWEEALARLRPEVEAALERLPEPGAVELVLWAVHVAERWSHVPEAWPRALRARAAGAPAVQDWGLARALAEDGPGESRHWLSLMRDSGRQPPAWVLLRMGRTEGDEVTVQGLLEARGAELSLPDRIAAERWLGHGTRAWTMLATEPRTGLSAAQLEALKVHARELGERYGSRVRLFASAGRLGRLALSEAGAEGRTGGPGGSQLRARASHLLLDEQGPGGLSRETVLSLGAVLGPERRITDMEVSLTRGTSGTWPSARVRQRMKLSPEARLGADAAWGEPSDETRSARLLGPRHRLGAALALGLPWRGVLSATVNARWYRTHAGARLGEGAVGALRLEWPWTVAGLDARVHLSGDVARRWLAPGGGALSLPGRSSHVGSGLLVRRGAPGALTWSAEAWGGWLWPEGQLGYHLRLGAGLPLASAGGLELRFAFGNASPGRAAGATGSVELVWEYRFAVGEVRP